LSGDAAGVEARAFIQPEFRQLIRDNTRFWAASGLHLNMGLTGLQLDVESLSTLATGGVALGTPDPPGKPVTTGHRFVLHAKPEDQWLAWRPRIALGSTLLPEGVSSPRPMRASLQWRERRFGLTRSRQLEAWVLPLDDGRLLGPANVLTVPSGAIDEEATLAIGGAEMPVQGETSRVNGALCLFDLPQGKLSPPQRWPRASLRVPQEPEDCLLVGDPQGPHVPLSAARLSAGAEGWAIDAAVSLDTSWHGASVVSRRDGAVIGLLDLQRGQARVLPLAAELLSD
jgi:hypothetical protein